MSRIEDNYLKWLNSKNVSDADKEFLRNMSEEQKADAFYKDIEFGTAGMRGILGPGTNRMNDQIVTKATVGFARYINEVFADCEKPLKVAIAHDNRHKSREFCLLTAKVLNELGIDAYIFDALRPTPELSYAVRRLGAQGGVILTASHNPKEYNGYKVYDETGCQLIPSKIERLIEIIASLGDELALTYEHAKVEGKTIVLDSTIDDEYVKLVESIELNKNLDKKGFKIVFTPNHGTAYVNGMRIFKDLGYEVYPLLKQCTPDPDFSNTLSPNPEDVRSYIEPIKYAKEIGAQLVVMTDPDGDRCGLAALNQKGEYELFTGNQSAVMLMHYIFSYKKEHGLLAENGAMYNTIVTSQMGKKVAAAFGIKTEQFLTGFKFIGNRIDYYEKQGGGPKFEFGYEESYGCLLAPFARDKDGLQAITAYCEMALHYYRQGMTLDMVWDMIGEIYGYSCDEVFNLSFPGPEGAKKMSELMSILHNDPFITLNGKKAVKAEDFLSQTTTYASGKKESIDLPKSNVVKLTFEDDTVMCARPSGTEPKVKFYIGVLGKKEDNLKEKCQRVYDDLKKLLNL